MLTVEKLEEMNSWWRSEEIRKELVPDYRRKLFFEIGNYINLRQIVAVIGLRRTGKTTIFYQVIKDLIKGGIEPKKVLYFSFDESVEELKEVLDVYREGIIKEDIGKERIYVFLDEIQKLKDWQNKIKIYYDLYPKIKFFISGSASINIMLDAKESLAGRIFYFNIDILSFEEFLNLRGKNVKEIKKNPELWKKELKTELNNYLVKPFPEIVNSNDEIAKKYVKEVIMEKAIFRDLSSLFEIKDLELIQKIVEIIASNPGMIINLSDFSKDLGRSRQAISNYLSYLEYCFILKSIRNFSGSLKTASRKLKKYYPIHPALAIALANPEQGKIAENLVRDLTHAEYFWRKGDKEVDFVITKDKKIFPIEVKYTSNVRNRDLKGMLNFMKEKKVKQGLVITLDLESIETINSNKIRLIPLWKFLIEPF